MAKEDWSEAKAWMRATRERIGMTQHDAAVLANLTVDMVKKYESAQGRDEGHALVLPRLRPARWAARLGPGRGIREAPCRRRARGRRAA